MCLKGLGKTVSHTFEDFLTQSLRAQNPEELFDCLTKTAEHHGYDKVIFTITRDGDLPEDKTGLGVFYNYPLDWQKYYSEKRFDLIDPVLHCAGRYDRAFTWQELEDKLQLSRKQHCFFREGEDAGLRNGIGVPIRGSRGQLAGIAMASSEQQDSCNSNLDLMTAFCNQFYIAYKRLHQPDTYNNNVRLQRLSPKELEVLKWMAAAKTDEEIADILSISRNTVNTHARHIFDKLDVYNRVSAVVKGIMMGLVHPHF